jgi:NADH dehydrogenase
MTTEQARSVNPHRVVIVGAGFGGLETAHRLAGAPVHITLVDRRNHHLFQPLLYQVATASLATSEIARSTAQSRTARPLLQVGNASWDRTPRLTPPDRLQYPR